jgi:hypothetical protein
MIDDSYAWKDRLRRGRAVVRRKLRAAAEDPARLEVALIEVEAFVFLTGYIVRKMSEAQKLSDELESATMSVVAYPARPTYPLDFLSAHHIDRGYDLEAPGARSLTLRTLCNLLIHSFVFMTVTDEIGTDWNGFFVNSDRTKGRELLYVARDDFDLLVDEVISDDVVTMRVDRILNRVTKSRVLDGHPVPQISFNASR